MDAETLRCWNDRIRSDLDYRISTWDRRWDENYKLVNNKDDKVLYGNLIKEYFQVLFSKTIINNPKVVVTPDDNKYQQKAINYAIVAQALCRIVNFKKHLRDAVTRAGHSIGFLYIGHPIVRWGVDPKFRREFNNNVVRNDFFEEDFQPVDASQVGNINPEDLDVYNPPSEESSVSSNSDTKPVFNDVKIDFPYIECVSAKHVVVQKGIKYMQDSDYVCRLRLLTWDELSSLADKKLNRDDFSIAPMEYMNLFPEFDKDFYLNDGYLLLEVWIKRNRANKNFNNWYTCFVLDRPENPIRNSVNPWGGMVPFTPLVHSDIGDFYDNEIVTDIKRLAQLYSLTMQSIERDVQKSLATKVLVDDRAGPINKDQGEDLSNPLYNGMIKVGNVEGIKELNQSTFSYEKAQLLSMIRNLAQRATTLSDLDMAQPIKKITARQTEQIVEATGQVINSIREMASESGADVIMKLMFILHIYHGEGMEFKYGSSTVVWNPQDSDMNFNLIFNIRLEDMGPDANESERLLFIQAIRTLGQFKEMLPYCQLKVLAKQFARLFNIDEEFANQQSQQFNPAAQAMQLLSPGNEDRLNGGHMPGDQGLGMDLGNNASGMRRTT